MEEFQSIIDWFFDSWLRIYNFFIESHPIVQMKVFLPLALLVVGIFVSFVKRDERSI